MKIPRRYVSIAELFRNAGYETAAFVSHLYVGRHLGFDKGFDRFDQTEAGGPLYQSSAGITNRALRLVDERSRERPLFLFLHFFDPHWSYLIHPPHDFYPDYAGPVRGISGIGQLNELAPTMSPDDLRYVRARYDSEIRFVDEHVGSLMAALRERGLFDDTAIVFTADHGEEFAERGDGYIGHGRRLYQTDLHVPLIVKPPRQRQGRRESRWVSLIDLAPTLAAMASVDVSDVPFRGRALPLAMGRREGRPLLAQNGAAQILVDEGWKLLSLDRGSRFELYDLATDPGELEDRSRSETERLQRLRTGLQALGRTLEYGSGSRPPSQPLFSEEEREQLRALGYAN